MLQSDDVFVTALTLRRGDGRNHQVTGTGRSLRQVPLTHTATACRHVHHRIRSPELADDRSLRPTDILHHAAANPM